MQTQRNRRVSGHVYRKQQKKGPTWYWKVRLPDGGEERKAIGPEWTGTDRPPDGYFTKRTAQVALEARLTDLHRSVGISTRTGATFDDAAELWYTLGKTEKSWKPSTQRDYRWATATPTCLAAPGSPCCIGATAFLTQCSRRARRSSTIP
jgi:hypothetical protein